MGRILLSSEPYIRKHLLPGTWKPGQRTRLRGVCARKFNALTWVIIVFNVTLITVKMGSGQIYGMSVFNTSFDVGSSMYISFIQYYTSQIGGAVYITV
ncbi:hypothetical protein BDP27DRAFT_307239 [Rhodocollybia butyracea]|uniref:Uncharacterized protein n=1 Tax=Rhodocollybia butyracea TaxID=206335 RepID=A0A9P5TZY1_9AGAR|nr:hypothetical protein BDP27DRAFT_307239 [Rhodocollybia butyracea]